MECQVCCMRSGAAEEALLPQQLQGRRLLPQGLELSVNQGLFYDVPV